MEFISEFIDFMESKGIKPSRPSDIKITKNIIRFHIEGDDKKKRNGACQLYNGGDGFASGWVKNWSTGVTEKWYRKPNRKFTDEERRAWAKKREEAQKKFKEEEQAKHKASADKALRIWATAERGEHKYLAKKKIGSLGSRVFKHALVVPAYKNKKIVSLQFISKDGDKRFLKGGDMNGASGGIGSDTSKIYLAEGFATAQSIYACVKPYRCEWAFNSGNLLKVAKGLREKFPDSEIIICADNDQWTVVNGKPKNVGVISGLETARAVKGLFIEPLVDHEDERKLTDFNDLHCHYDLEYVKNRLSEASSPDSGGVVYPDVVLESTSASAPNIEFAPLEAYDEYAPSQELQEVGDWMDLMIMDSKGEPQKGSLKNKILILTHADRFKGIFKYNEFHQQITVIKCPPWENMNKFEVHELNDIDISQTASALEQHGLSPDTGATHKAIEVVANENSFNPAKEYLEGLEWDGKQRLDKWLTYYLGAEDDNPEYLGLIGKKWLTAGVKRVYQAGCDFHHVLVMEGKQGAGKSTALRELATFGTAKKEAYFTDQIGIADIHDKDTIKMLQGSIIVELAELAGFSKKDDEEVKSWITTPCDHTRLPYARTPVKFPRQFILSATTNSYDYLKDPTGNRRYWCFKVGKIDMEAIKEDRMQLWAEAVQCYKDGMPIYLNNQENELAVEAQEKRRAIDSWEDDVLDAISELGFSAHQDGFKVESVMKRMGLGLKERDYRATSRVRAILQMNGYISGVQSVNGKSIRVWKKGE